MMPRNAPEANRLVVMPVLKKESIICTSNSPPPYGAITGIIIL